MSFEHVIHPLLWLLFTLLVVTNGCPNSTLIAPCDCNDNPSTIECMHKNLTSVPTNLLEPFDELWIEGNNINIVTSVPYSNITLLQMQYNQIKTIKPGAFKTLTYLKTLILSKNAIKLTDAKEFEGLGNLEILNMDNNYIGELKDGAFTGQYLLKIFDIKLSFCQITKVDVSAFNNLPTLRKLDLSNNKISKTPVFKPRNNLNILTELDLSHNMLTELHNDTFHDLPALRILDLSYNRIRVVTPLVFHAVLNTLISLDMGFNQLGTEMPFALQHMRKLTTLDISNNNIETLYPESLNWEALEKPVISDNPWHCTCGSGWIIHEDIVRKWNKNNSVKCAYPEDVAGQSVFEIDPTHLACDGRGGRGGVTDALGVTIACIISILIILAVAYFLYRRTAQWRLKRRGNLIPHVSSQYKRVKDEQKAQLVF